MTTIARAGRWAEQATARRAETSELIGACVPPFSAHEELARWVIRAVNVRMTVHARSTEHPVALVGGDLVLVVERRRMAAGDVAALAEHRHPHDQHPVVRRSVRVVTRRAVLAYRRVLPQHRTAHLGVAAGTQFADRAADLEVLDVA